MPLVLETEDLKIEFLTWMKATIKREKRELVKKNYHGLKICSGCHKSSSEV